MMTFDNHRIKPLLAVLAVAVAVLAAFAVVQAPAADEGEGPDWIHASIEKALAEAPEGAELTGFYAVGYTDGEGAPLKVSDAEGRFLEDVSGKGPAGDDVTIISGGKWVFEGQSLVLQAGWDRVPGQCTLRFVFDGITFTETAIIGEDAPAIGDAEDKEGNALSGAIAAKTGWYAVGVKLQNSYVADATLSWTSGDLVRGGLWAADKDMRFTVETSNAYTVVLWDNGIHVANVEARYGEPFSIPSEYMSEDPLFTGYATSDGDVVVTFDGTTVPGVEGVTDGEGRWASAANVDLYAVLAESGSGGSPGDGKHAATMGVVYTADINGGATLTGAYKVESPSELYTGDLVLPEYVKQTEASGLPLYAPAEDGDEGAVAVVDLCFYNGSSTLGATSVTVPATLASVGERAFSECSSLKSVSMPSVISVGESAFSECYILESVSMPSVTSVGERAFSECYFLSSMEMPSVTSIGDSAFCDCTGLESVSMPETVSIDAEAFNSCSSLVSVDMPKAVSLGYLAFVNCESLKSVNMPAVSSIRDSVFEYCTSLESVFIPASATDIGVAPFEGCTSLTSIQVDGSNTAYTSMDGVLFTKDCRTLIQFPGGVGGSYLVPGDVKTIADCAFSQSSSLESVSMPSVTSLDVNAFFKCSSLESVSMPSVTFIGIGAFSDCFRLSTVTFGVHSMTVGDDVFPGEGLNNTTVGSGTYVLTEGAWVKQP